MDHFCQVDFYYEEKKMLDSNDPAIQQEGIDRLLAEAQKGSPEAQAIVGESYYYGTGFPQDYEQAFYWCKKAAITGAEYSNVILGNMYEFGNGVQKDYLEAIRWYHREVSGGYTFAQPEIDRCLEKMKQEGILEDETMYDFPKHFLEAYEEWFENTNEQKNICDMPAKIGDVFSMGQYPIGADGSKQPILWSVVGESEGKLLAVSEYCIEWAPYNVRQACTWENSLLCSFMKDFYEDAFSELEQQKIVTVEEEMGSIFALSVKEANTYFKCNRDRRATATPYAIMRGAHIVPEATMVREFAEPDCQLPHAVCWWLRDRGFSPMYAADVMPDGCVCDSGDDFEEAGGVRPAMWIKTVS